LLSKKKFFFCVSYEILISYCRFKLHGLYKIFNRFINFLCCTSPRVELVNGWGSDRCLAKCLTDCKNGWTDGWMDVQRRVDRLVNFWTTVESTLNKPTRSEVSVNCLKSQDPRISFNMTQSDFPKPALLTMVERYVCSSKIFVSRTL
jgi:hypothetical protein